MGAHARGCLRLSAVSPHAHPPPPPLRAQVAFSSLLAVSGLQLASALQTVPLVTKPRAVAVSMQQGGGITEVGVNENEAGNYRRLSDVRRAARPPTRCT